MRNATLFLRIAIILSISALWVGAQSASAQEPGASWQSAIIWAPTLTEAGAAIATHVNQIDAACAVDIDPIASTNGAGPEGAVYAFSIAWSCPATNGTATGLTWQSAMIWDSTLEVVAAGLAAHLNQTEATCQVDIDNVQSTNGMGPEGAVYAFLVTWAC